MVPIEQPGVLGAAVSVVLLVGALAAARIRDDRRTASVPHPESLRGLQGRMTDARRARLANGRTLPARPAPGTRSPAAGERIVVAGVDRGSVLVVAAPDRPGGTHARPQ